MLIITFGMVLVASGIAEYFHLSLILTNMVIGFVLVNTRRPTLVTKVTAPLQEVMPLVFLLFFCLAGAHLKVSELPQLGLVGLVYILGRSGGLILGAWIGASVGHVEAKIKKYIGLGILSQAGVAIGLSLIVRQDFVSLSEKPEVAAAIARFAAAHPDVSGVFYNPLTISAALITTVTATCIVFEIIGPILTKVALIKAGEINVETEKGD
jgi:Kef-type K+ transport system membrane component KefB